MSARDRERHEAENLLEKLKDSPHLWEKFTINGSLAYEPLEVLIEAGLEEICDKVSPSTASSEGSNGSQWAESACEATEPTQVDYDMAYGEAVSMRLDFVLMTPGCTTWAKKKSKKKSSNEADTTNASDMATKRRRLSSHFPDCEDGDRGWESEPDWSNGATCGDGKPWVAGFVPAYHLDENNDSTPEEMLIVAQVHI